MNEPKLSASETLEAILKAGEERDRQYYYTINWQFPGQVGAQEAAMIDELKRLRAALRKALELAEFFSPVEDEAAILAALKGTK